MNVPDRKPGLHPLERIAETAQAIHEHGGPNWFIVIDLASNGAVYGGPDGDAARAAFNALPYALMGGQHRPESYGPPAGAMATETLWTRQKGTPPPARKEALRGD